MKQKAIMFSALLSLFGIGCSAPVDPKLAPKNETLYDFTMKSIDGKEVPLTEYKGKVVVVVNVASKCGLTPQYEGLQSLYAKYKDKGLVVLGFPANDFMGQEPGTNEEIKSFCSTKYNVTFPMFSKITVTGDEMHPMYRWLIAKSGRDEAIEWNFAKFIVNRDGKTLKRFSPRTKPDDKEFLAALDSALNTK